MNKIDFEVKRRILELSLNPTMLFLSYELRSSLWAKYIWFNWGQNLASKYFAWKVRKKTDRFYLNLLHEKNN